MDPDIRYARSGNIAIAYQVVGDGQTDLVYIPDYISNLVYGWESTHWRRFYNRLARSFRLILFDKRGTGLSDFGGQFPSLVATLLFTDIARSTERASALGDRGWRDLLDRHHSLVRRELVRFRGEEKDTAGDGFFATFDGPARAIRCAEAVVAGVSDLGLDVRAGAHTGECEVHDDKVAGIAVSIGARVAAQAGPGEVLVS